MDEALFFVYGKRFEHQRYIESKQKHEKMLNIITREIKIKTTMRPHYIPIRLA